MATKPYTPVEELDMLCKYCKKPMPAVVERGVPDTGRIIDETATFEYVCTKCNRTHYYLGSDLLEDVSQEDAVEGEESETEEEAKPVEAREYSISEKYRIGEFIKHPSFEDIDGKIVGKIHGNPGQIIVQFNKKIKYFIENAKAK